MRKFLQNVKKIIDNEPSLNDYLEVGEDGVIKGVEK